MYCVVDIETTGGNPRNSKVIEIAIYKYDGNKIIDEYESLVQPGFSVSPFITKLTGISDNMLVKAPYFYEIADKVLEFLDDAVFVAHNVQFDYGILKSEFKALNKIFKRPKLCTVELSRRFFPELASHSLGNICKSLNIEIEGRHRAFGDAKATVVLLEKIFERDIHNDIDANYVVDHQLKKLPDNIHKDQVMSLPEDAGIFFLHNKNNDVIFLKNTSDIFASALRKITAKNSSKSISIAALTDDLSFEVIPSPLIAMILEFQYLMDYQPKHNRIPRFISYPYALVARQNDDSDILLSVEKASSVTNELVLDRYKTAKESQAQILKIIENNQLCPKICGDYSLPYGCTVSSRYCCAIDDPKQRGKMNQNIERLLRRVTYNYQNMLVIDKGRDQWEQSVIAIFNNKLYGWNYIDANETNMAHILDGLQIIDSDWGIEKKVRRYLRNHSNIKRINLDKNQTLDLSPYQ